MPTIHPAPGRYKLVPYPEQYLDRGPVFVEVSEDAFALSRDDMPEVTYTWNGGEYVRPSTTESGGFFSFVCHGSTYSHWYTPPFLPPVLLDEGHCEPA